MSKQHFDESYAASAPENYERFFVPAIGRPLAADLVQSAALRPGEHVLDVACGTGIVARLACDRVGSEGSVAGLDLDAGMLAVARAATPSSSSIDWHEASAESMPLPDEAFDAALCQMGLQFMPDRGAAFGEMHRVLTTNGRALVNLPGPTPPMFEILAEAMGNHIAPEAAGFVTHVFSLHDDDEIRELMTAAGFREVSAEANTKTLRLPAPRDFLWQYVWGTPLAGLAGSADEAARDALEKDVVGRWAEFAEDGGMTLPLRVVVAGGSR